MPTVYAELHQLADRYMRRERVGHTLRPTDLVAEAYEKLVDASPDLHDRVHFFAIAARVMRQIPVDHARKRTTAKRGSGERPVTLDEALVGGGRPEELIELDRALEELAKFDARRARAVELHYFGGLTHDEVAEALDVHVNAVAREPSPRRGVVAQPAPRDRVSSRAHVLDVRAHDPRVGERRWR